MKIKILTPKATVFDGQAKEAILPGEDGEFSVWDSHQPCMYKLRQGTIRLKSTLTEKQEKDLEVFQIKRGLVKVDFEGMVILVQEMIKR